MVEYRADQAVRRVDPATRTLHTEFEAVAGDVLNLIPPQQAGAIARAAGLTAADGRWCPVEPLSFESRLAPGVHVIGDACAAGAMPKSAFAASSQAKGAAHNIAALLAGRQPEPHVPINTCYSFVSDREAMSVAAVYRPRDGQLAAVPNSGGVSPRYSTAEGEHARSWLANILADSFG
jgi:sulfide dehydrogenase [flavocytochrome c] flavoprotein subunit